MEVWKWNILHEKIVISYLFDDKNTTQFWKSFIFNLTLRHLLGELGIQICLRNRLNYKLLLPSSRTFDSYFMNAFLDIGQKEKYVNFIPLNKYLLSLLLQWKRTLKHLQSFINYDVWIMSIYLQTKSI